MRDRVLFLPHSQLLTPSVLMAPGRPKLDPEVKQQCRIESLQRYAAKLAHKTQKFFQVLTNSNYCRNADKLRERARIRMQRYVYQ
jgi:hypothetical protein